MSADRSAAERLRELRDNIVRSVGMSIPPVTAELLRLRERGMLEPEPYSFGWLRQRGIV